MTTPPFKAQPTRSDRDLESIEPHIRQALRKKDVYDIVIIGLCLLKAKEVLLVDTAFTRRDETSGKLLPAKDGFLDWLARQFPEISDRTARRYMNAARNVALTSDHTLAAVEELRANAVLHDIRPSNLYRPQNGSQIKELEVKPAPPSSVVSDIALARRIALDQTLSARDLMSQQEFEAAKLELKDTLEKLAGTRFVEWNPSDPSDLAVSQIARSHSGSRKKNRPTAGKRTKANLRSTF